MPDGRAIAFVARDENGSTGVFVQDFRPGEDTAKTRRPLGGFDPDAPTESFGISPDGSRMIVSTFDQQSGVMVAEGVPGVFPPQRRARR